VDKEMRRIFVIICVLISTLSFSQDKVELLNKGNEYFQEGDFEKAEEYYKESLEVDNQYYKANLNTGHSLFRQAFSLIQKQDTTGLKKCSDAELFYKNSVELTENKNDKSESLYNLGNAQILSQNLEESIESYKQSLRLIPGNMNAKHNLALAQYLLNKKQKNQENQENSKEEDNKEKKKDQNKEDKQKEKEEKKEELSKEEIEQILKALEREEKEVQEDLQKKKVIGGNKLLKDW
jgi:Ca-activated chloride channel homolog